MEKSEILKAFFSLQYRPDGLYDLYQRAVLNTEPDLQDEIMEIVFRHINKEARKLVNSLKISFEAALEMILNIHKLES